MGHEPPLRCDHASTVWLFVEASDAHWLPPRNTEYLRYAVRQADRLLSPQARTGTAFHCARRGQMEAQKWIAEHSEWRVERWSCQPYGKLRFKI